MNKILEHASSDEESVVSRILVQVHKAVDQHFPTIRNPDRQFTKTVFSDDGESTAIKSPGAANDEEPGGSFANSDDTSPDGRVAPSCTPEGADAKDHVPPPVEERTSGLGLTSSNMPPVPSISLPEEQNSTDSRAEDGPDWVIRITLALLLAGLVLLGYVLLA